MKVYVASSWRNERYPEVVKALAADGHTVYDFRNTKPEGGAFNWEQIDPAWEWWNTKYYLAALQHPLAIRAFGHDSISPNP